MAQLATINPLNQFFALNGLPLNNGKLYFGSINADPEQSPVQMYWDSAGLVPALQPIRTTSGYPARNGSPAVLYCAVEYSLRVRQSNDVQVFYLPRAGSVGLQTFGQWQPTTTTPSYASANSFTMTGDQTAEFQAGRRARFSVTAGTVYGTILSSVYGSLTTVMMSMDGTTALDAGLSSVDLSLLTSINPALPSIADEWQLSLATSSYISATSFSSPGDQTGILKIGRRLKSTNTGGTVYSTITNSVFAAGITTVTVVNTSGVLDSGLSHVRYGLLSPDNPSLPNSSAVRVSMGISAQARCKGLRGANNAATPTTKLDLSAAAVTVKNAAGDAIVVTGVGTATLDFGLAGPAANGRDQAGAFSASQFLNVFWIYNPTTATMALTTSIVASTGAPALPTGYTYYAFATTVRWNGSSNIQPCSILGSTHFYQVTLNILSGGADTAETAIANFPAAVPSNALNYFSELIQTNGSASQQNSSLRYIAGSIFLQPNVGPNGYSSTPIKLPYVGANLYYNTSNASNLIGVNVSSYVVANGDS